MTITFTPLRCLAATLLALGAVASQAAPAGKPLDPARLQYERERADCMMGRTHQPRNVCLREARAAYAQARSGQLSSANDGPQQWQANALQRCQAQPPEERDLCERRVREGQVVGSVDGGGQITTLTIRSTDIDRSSGS